MGPTEGTAHAEHLLENEDGSESEPNSADSIDRDRLTPQQLAEVLSARSKAVPTLRGTVQALEAILYKPLPVLDHGFVRLVDYMGDDAAVVQAARVSYGKGTKKVSEDQGLINYLMRHRHTTPFEMCEIKLHVKLPIFVARQWIRHRTANVNEYSARYSVLDKEFYVPDRDYLGTRREERKIEQNLQEGQPDLFGVVSADHLRHLASQSAINKQGREDVLPQNEANEILGWIKSESSRAYSLYLKLLNENEKGDVKEATRHGLARELARMVLPASIYTQWYWKTDLHNLLHFLSLRADAHAQYEIRAYADVILDEIVKPWVPLTYAAFMEYRMSGIHLSGSGLDVVRRMAAGELVTQEESGLSKREWRELMAALNREG